MFTSVLDSACFEGEIAVFELLRIDKDLVLAPAALLLSGERTEYAGEIAMLAALYHLPQISEGL